MIDRIDKPYINEQVQHLNYQLEKVYFDNESQEIRKEVGKLLKRLSNYCNFNEKFLFIFKTICSKYDTGNSSIAYYLFYQLSTNKSISATIITIIKRLFNIK